MQVKKFEAPTLQEALDTIKRELGPEAIILQTKSNKRGFGLMSKGSVEVTAAVSDRSIQKKSVAERRLPDPEKERLRAQPAALQADTHEKAMDQHLERAMRGVGHDQVSLGKGATAGAKQRPITARRYADIDDVPANGASAARTRTPARPVAPATQAAQAAAAVRSSTVETTRFQAHAGVEEEVRHLKRMIEELKTAQDAGVTGTGVQTLMRDGALSTVPLQDAFENLVMNGVDKRYALPLLKKVAFELGERAAQDPDAVMDQVAQELMTATRVLPVDAARKPEKGPEIIALVGPTGVGKTTTVAKIASLALLKRKLKVGLINLDNYKVAAFDQLSTYAKILNLPFRSAVNQEDLQAAIADFQGLDLVLIDTTGRSQRDAESLSETERLLACIPGVRTQLVLSSTTRDAEQYEIASRFGIFKPEGLILSKLDESRFYGTIHNLGQKTRLPLVYFTTGQRVPEDIEEASSERVAALVLDL